MSGTDEPTNGRAWYRKGGSPMQIPRRSPSPSGLGPDLAATGRVHSSEAVSGSKGSPGRLDMTDGLRLKRRHAKTAGSTPDEHPPEVKLPNFFDFDENLEDIFVESPETLVKKMREKAKERLKQEAKPYTPDEKVETIGGAYVEEIEERAISTMKRKLQPESGTPPSHHFSTPTASKPRDGILLICRLRRTETDSPITTRDIIRRDDKIAALERQLEDLKVGKWKSPPIHETINRILLGQSYSLDWYKSLEDKVALLDAAIATNDGNCIIAILLFIKRTLDHHLLVSLLLRKPVAGRHYCSFLKQLQAWSELSSVYRTLSDYKSYGYLRLQQCEQCGDPTSRVKQLRACFVTFKSTPELQADAQYVDEYIRLTEKQQRIEESDTHGSANIRRAGNIVFTPLTTTLLYCCRYHTDEPEGYSHPGSPEGLRKAFNISEKQFFQVSLMALSLAQDWKGVDELVTSKGVFGLGKKKKSPIGFERVVKTIAVKKYRAPDNVITKYLNEIEDLELRLSLATQVEVFDVGIEALKQLRDKERLVSYINLIPVQRQREFRPKIQTLLSNTQIRWK